jgi:hypothetical protein
MTEATSLRVTDAFRGTVRIVRSFGAMGVSIPDRETGACCQLFPSSG